MRAWLTLALLLVSATSASATVVATELTSGSAIDVSSVTTASIAPTNGALVILVVTTRKDVCTTLTVTGLSSTWTVRDTQSIISNVFVHTLLTTTSNGTSGTVGLSWATGHCANIAYDIVQYTGINTASNDGYVKSSHTNLTGCSPCMLSQGLSGGYTDTADTQISSCMANTATGGSTVSFTAAGSWAQGSTVITANSSASDRLVLGVGWLITKGANTGVSTCTVTTGGAADSMIFTSEFTASPNVGPKHKVTTL